MTPKELMKIPMKSEFMAIRDMLNLTDRQRAIFSLKYGKGWTHISIGVELGINQDTVGTDVKDIEEKLAVIGRENIENNPTVEETTDDYSE